jgi:hypothetical protein
MARFVHLEYSMQHPGVARVERAAEALQSAAIGRDAFRAAGTLALAGVVAAALVVANQLVDTWTEGHLLAAWVVMWLVAFAALALFAAPIKRSLGTVRAGYAAWAERRRQAHEDDKLWSLALNDARVMADLSRAMARDAERDVRGYY